MNASKQMMIGLCLCVGGMLMLTGCQTKKQAALEREKLTVVQAPETVPATEKLPPQEEFKPATEETLPPPSPPVVETPKEETVVYTVQKGDTLSGIAARFGLKQSDILALNKKIANKNKVFAGQKLTLPACDLNAPALKPQLRKADPAPALKKPTPSDKDVAYTVVGGDTLSGIAYAHGVKVAAIKSANGLSSDKLQVGQKLTIPAPSKKPAEKPTAPKEKASKKTDTTAPVEKTAEPTTPEVDPTLLPPTPVEDEEVLPPPAVPVAEAVRTVTLDKDTDIFIFSMNWNVTAGALRELNGFAADLSIIPAGTVVKLPGLPDAQ